MSDKVNQSWVPASRRVVHLCEADPRAFRHGARLIVPFAHCTPERQTCQSYTRPCPPTNITFMLKNVSLMKLLAFSELVQFKGLA